MSYFLKKSNIKNDTYYQVYEGFHDPIKGYTVQKSIKVIGYHSALLNSGIPDPLQYATDIVKDMELNRKKNLIEKNTLKISSSSPIRNLGFMLPISLLNKFDISNDFSFLTLGRKIKYSLYEVFTSLVAARIVAPASNIKAYEDTIPSLANNYNFSYDQILDGLEIIGQNYYQIIQIINKHYKKFYRRDTSNVYFDCTNYYFEIDKPFQDKQKGPSKENRKDPIIGMALLLDKDQIPLSMHMYPGNQSEKPEIRAIISNMKSTSNVEGKTIQVADKGLNCAKNIYEALKDGDGYIFSQSVKQLPKIEKDWIDIENQYKVTIENGIMTFKIKSCVDDFKYSFTENGQKQEFTITQKRVVYWSKKLEDKHKLEIISEIDKLNKLTLSQVKKKDIGDLAKYLKLGSVDEDGILNFSNIKTFIDQDKIDADLKYCGYNMIITSEIKMKDEDIISVYRNLWRIEESFRILKTNLVARPVYVSKQDTIYGHFLICYVALFLMRVLELKVFKDKIPANQLFEFCRKFNVVKTDDSFINLLSKKEKDNPIFDLIRLPIDNYYLTAKDLEMFEKCIL